MVTVAVQNCGQYYSQIIWEDFNMAFTRQYYKAIAEIVKKSAFWSHHGPCREDRDKMILPESIASNLANYFAKNNPKFDREHFLAACGL